MSKKVNFNSKIIFLFILLFKTSKAMDYTCLNINQNFPEDFVAPAIAHIATIDLSKMDLELKRAGTYSLERQTIDQIALKFSNDIDDQNVFINAGFFRRGGRFNGNSLWLTKIKQNIFSDPCSRGCTIICNADRSIEIEYIESSCDLKVNNMILNVDRINQPIEDNEIGLYTASFYPTTLTNSNTYKYVIEKNKIVAIEKKIEALIPEDGYVLVSNNLNQNISIGDEVVLNYNIKNQLSGKKYNDCLWAITGAGVILYKSQILDSEAIYSDIANRKSAVSCEDEISFNTSNPKECDWMINGNHPRTGIGITSDNKIVFIVVEGRRPGISEGINLPDFGKLFYKLGCVSALNLGGGGDSSIIVNNKLCFISSGSTEQAKQGKFQLRPISDVFSVKIHENEMQ